MSHEQSELPIDPPTDRPDSPPPDLPAPREDTLSLDTSAAVRTPSIPRPRPQGGPAATELDAVPKDADRIALFSGGMDSAATTVYAMERLDADIVLYLDTNTGLAENLEYVRAVCESQNWPLVVEASPVEYETICRRYGAPGPDAHGWVYGYLKDRQLRDTARRVDGTVKYFTGVNKYESGRRKLNVTEEVEYHDDTAWRGYWVSPLWDVKDEDREALVERAGITPNPLYEKIGRSGDCWCLAYGAWDEIYHALMSIADPDDRDDRLADHGAWLLNTQTRIQEYRGRLALLRDHSPDRLAAVDELRKKQVPHPSRVQVLKQHYPALYDEAIGYSIREAVRRGKEDITNYIGHGNASTTELRAVIAANASEQSTLCGTCSSKSFGE